MNTGYDISTIRSLINRTLIMDSDFDAFCLDYFPEIKRRFTDGMDRVRKVNLLLEIASPLDILKALDRDIIRTKENSETKSPRSVAAEELIPILEYRANRIIRFLLDNQPKYLERFIELHQWHISSLRAGQMIFAHETARDIHGLLRHIAEEEVQRSTFWSIIGRWLNKKKSVSKLQSISEEWELNTGYPMSENVRKSMQNSAIDHAPQRAEKNNEASIQIPDELLIYHTDTPLSRPRPIFDPDHSDTTQELQPAIISLPPGISEHNSHANTGMCLKTIPEHFTIENHTNSTIDSYHDTATSLPVTLDGKKRK